MSKRDTSQRDTWADDVELYDRTRLELPPPLFRALLERIPPGPHRRLLVADAGTGKTTFVLVVTQNQITALEPDPRRAAFAADRLAHFSNVAVVEADLGAWPQPDRLLDTVLAFTGDLSDPVVSLDKAAEVLRPGGELVLIYVRQIAGGDDQFLAEAHECRRRFDPGLEPNFRLPAADQLERPADISDSGLFRKPSNRRQRWDVTYPARQYADVELAYDPHTRSMPEPTRTKYLDDITTLIKESYGGRVTMRYQFELQAAVRRSRPRSGTTQGRTTASSSRGRS